MLPQGCWLGPIQPLYCLWTSCFCLESSYLTASQLGGGSSGSFGFRSIDSVTSSQVPHREAEEYSCPSVSPDIKWEWCCYQHMPSHTVKMKEGGCLKKKCNTLIRYQYYHCLCDMHLRSCHSSKISVSRGYLVKIKIQSVCLINIAATQPSFFCQQIALLLSVM